MFQAIIDIDFCYGHRLVGHEGKCKFLHGHSSVLTLYLASPELNHGQHDMVMDFGHAKPLAKRWVDEVLDHTLLLHEEDPLVPILQHHGERFLLLKRRPTAEVIAQFIFEHLSQQGLPLAQVSLSETRHTRVSYNPPLLI